jgi:hypothetical protein
VQIAIVAGLALAFNTAPSVAAGNFLYSQTTTYQSYIAAIASL